MAGRPGGAAEEDVMEISDDMHRAYAWLQGGDTGSSSETIWHFMMHGRVVRPNIPYDPADFGRCHRLLARFPAWRQRLDEMAEVLPMWRPFAAAWSELEVLWDEETKRPDGCAPKLYKRMSKLVEESRKCQ